MSRMIVYTTGRLYTVVMLRMYVNCWTGDVWSPFQKVAVTNKCLTACWSVDDVPWYYMFGAFICNI